jgi:hypothetical protein
MEAFALNCLNALDSDGGAGAAAVINSLGTLVQCAVVIDSVAAVNNTLACLGTHAE